MRSKLSSWALGVRMMGRAHRLVIGLALGWTLGAVNLLNAQSLTWLGTLGGSGSVAHDVSDDGSVVVGGSTHAIGQQRAFRWTASGGMEDLGTLGGNWSEAYGVSADGTVVVGTAFNSSMRYRAFRWSTQTWMQDLGTLGGNASWAYGVSANGHIVVGWAATSSQQHAFRWTAGTGMVDIGTLNGRYSEALGVSGNGAVIVGRSLNHIEEMWAFWWTMAYRMQPLYPLAVCCGESNGVSDNGAIIVGRSHSAQTERWHACLWWWNGSDYAPRDLGTLGGQESEAYACTNDQTAVGWSHNTAGQRRAFRWTPARGMEDLTAIYQNLLSSGSYLEAARDVTPDGRYIVGWGYNAATGRTEGFLLDTLCVAHSGDVDRNGCVDDADLLAVLFAFGATGQNLGRVDVNCDAVVDDADLLIVLFNFGAGC